MRQGTRLGRLAANSGGSAAAHTARSPFSLLRAMLRTILLLLAVVSVAYWLICAFGAITARDLGNDFLVYFSAALTLRDNPHADIYTLHTLQTVAASHSTPTPTLLYLYPPLLAIALIPLTLLPYRIALLTWTVFNLALWAYGTSILVQWAWKILGVAPFTSLGYHAAGGNESEPSAETRERLRARNDLALFVSTVTVLLSASFFPLLYGVINGQVTSLIFMLSLLALALLPRHPRLAGASLALATWIKLFPVVLIGYFLLRRRWRVVEGAALAAALLAALTLFIVGWQGLLAATSIVANGAVMAYAPHASWNLSLALVPLWLALALGGESSRALTLLGSAISVAVGVAFASGVFVEHRRAATRPRVAPAATIERPTERIIWQPRLPDLLGVSWGLCTMVLLSPVAWMHTYAWLLPPCIICLSVTLRLLLEWRRATTGNLSNTDDAPEVCVTHPHLLLLMVLVLLAAYAALAVPGYTRPTPSFTLLLHAQPLNLPLLLLHPIGALMVWCINGLLFLRSTRDIAQRATRTAADGPPPAEDSAARAAGVAGVALTPPLPSPRLLALALITLLVVIGMVEMLYWGIFLAVSTP